MVVNNSASQDHRSTPTPQEIAAARHWRGAFLHFVATFGQGPRAQSEALPAVCLRSLCATAYVRFEDEMKAGTLLPSDLVGHTLSVFEVVSHGEVGPQKPPSEQPGIEALLDRHFLVSRIALDAIPETLREIGWLRDEQGVDALRVVATRWMEWSGNLPNTPRAGCGAIVPPFLMEVLTGWPQVRPENYESATKYEEYMATVLSSRVNNAHPELRAADADGAEFRRCITPMLDGVNAESVARARAAAAGRAKRRNQGTDPAEVATNFVSQLFERGHRTPYGVPLPDGTVFAHPNTILGAHKVDRELDKGRATNGWKQSLDHSHDRLDRDQRLGRIDRLVNEESLARTTAAIDAAFDRARRECADAATDRAAMEYVIATSEHALDQRERRPTRAEFAKQFGVPAWDDRSAAERRAREGLADALKAEGIVLPS